MDYSTWFDQKPSHPPINPEISKLRSEIDSLWKERDSIIENRLNRNLLAFEDRIGEKRIQEIDRRILKAEKEICDIRNKKRSGGRIV